ncbi:hypothetical protein GCM10007108_11440 [Thermogymnomonas acidicola]|uniref:Uncharacterized protein n=1 Tax=Thermogymnomonas acidicola TaxID=399579 RepID=A0AA37BRL7_9ARCH|nr:hypothetical protein GCM10007108_11440 [Thermogymnomonas acidicola]
MAQALLKYTHRFWGGASSGLPDWAETCSWTVAQARGVYPQCTLSFRRRMCVRSL